MAQAPTSSYQIGNARLWRFQSEFWDAVDP